MGVTCKHMTLALTSKNKIETSLSVQWLGLQALTAEGVGPIPGPGTKIPQAAVWPKQKQNKKKRKKGEARRKLPQQTTKIITPYTVYWEALNQILSNYSMILNFSALSFPLAFKPLMSITSLKRKNSYLNPKYSFDQCLLLTSLRNLNFFITSIYFIFY